MSLIHEEASAGRRVKYVSFALGPLGTNASRPVHLTPSLRKGGSSLLDSKNQFSLENSSWTLLGAEVFVAGYHKKPHTL